jgi:GntR family transcriptional repressor for pyruvate dehydrogenase complex
MIAPMPSAPDDPADAIRRVQRATDQIADQLRDMIVSGALADGTRLPTEVELARRSGVSRNTIREALSILAAEGLTRTKKGARGGTFVDLPSREDVAAALRFGVTLLSRGNEISLAELFETRALMEVPTAGLAAERRTQQHVDALYACIPGALAHNKSFHDVVLEAAQNSVLAVVCQPVHHVMVPLLRHLEVPEGFQDAIDEHHLGLARAIERRNPVEARRLMQAHLDHLRSHYERFWR